MTRRLGLITGLLAVLVGCQTGTPATTQETGAESSPGVVTTDAVPTLGPPPSPTAAEDTSVTLDPTVLHFLPETVGGVPITESVDEATQALANASLQKIASALDAGVAVDTGNGNLVYALVVRLRPDKLTDDIFRQWRDSFDEGACSGAGGVTGHAEATIDDRTVYITSCVQGLRTYHVWLKDDGILISSSSIGEGKFGEVLMDNLRVPA